MGVTIGGGLVGQPEPAPIPAPIPVPTAPTGDAVLFQPDIQQPGPGKRIAFATFGTWANSRWAGIADGMIKIFSDFVSTSKGYAKQVIYTEARMDFNGIGGLSAGVTGIAEGHGTISTLPGYVNDVVGFNGIALKNTNCWAAGSHGEVRDTVGGGVAIGVNAEIVSLVPGTRGIGVHALNWGGNPAAESAFCAQGAFQHGVNLEGVSEMSHVMKLSSNGGHFIYEPKPSVAVIGKLQITIDGSTFYIPVCQ